MMTLERKFSKRYWPFWPPNYFSWSSHTAVSQSLVLAHSSTKLKKLAIMKDSCNYWHFSYNLSLEIWPGNISFICYWEQLVHCNILVVHPPPALPTPFQAAVWSEKCLLGLVLENTTLSSFCAYQKTLSALRTPTKLLFSCDQPWKVFLQPEWPNIPILTISKKGLTQTVARMKHCYD